MWTGCGGEDMMERNCLIDSGNAAGGTLGEEFVYTTRTFKDKLMGKFRKYDDGLVELHAIYTRVSADPPWQVTP